MRSDQLQESEKCASAKAETGVKILRLEQLPREVTEVSIENTGRYHGLVNCLSCDLLTPTATLNRASDGQNRNAAVATVEISTLEANLINSEL